VERALHERSRRNRLRPFRKSRDRSGRTGKYRPGHPVFFGSKTALTALKFTQALSENFIAYAGKINTIDNVQQPFMPGRGLDAGFMKRELAIFESYPAGVTRTFPDESHDSNPRFLVDHLSVRPGAMGRHHGSNAQLGRAMN
jgi:hypothetical protein